MEPEVRKKPVRFYEIDLLRFCAAMAVVFYHYTYRIFAADNMSQVEYPALGQVFRYGWLGVELFFIISGYVVLLSAQGKTVRQFFTSRVTRLYPVYWVAVTFTTLAIYFLAPPAGHPPFRQYAWNLTMLNTLGLVGNIDNSYWSLRVEIGFYFLIAILIGWKLLNHLHVVLFAWLVFCFFGGPNPIIESSLWTLFFPRYAPYFISGMLFFLLQQRSGPAWKNYALLVPAYLLSLRSARTEYVMLSGKTFFGPEALSQLTVLGIVTAFFGIFFLIVSGRVRLNKPWIATLGSLTYPLYLIHGPLGVILYQRIGNQVNKYVLLIGIVIPMLLASWVIHRYIERPASKLLGQGVNKVLDTLGTWS